MPLGISSFLSIEIRLPFELMRLYMFYFVCVCEPFEYLPINEQPKRWQEKRITIFTITSKHNKPFGDDVKTFEK